VVCGALVHGRRPTRRRRGDHGLGAGNGYVVFTHDLDFGTTLALTQATGPSVLQVRGQNVLPEDLGPVVVAALRQCDAALAAGALVTVDVKKPRVRVLPL
jgi:predicted nuclease of predicted toxin-antitoxin system